MTRRIGSGSQSPCRELEYNVDGLVRRGNLAKWEGYTTEKITREPQECPKESRRNVNNKDRALIS